MEVKMGFYFVVCVIDCVMCFLKINFRDNIERWYFFFFFYF